MKRFLLLILSFVGGLCAFSQVDNREVIGVAQFTSEVNSPFIASVSEKVVQVVTNSRRFIVVDRTSYDKIQAELEFQKTEAFIDSKNTAEQGVAMAAKYMIIGHLIKLNIYTMKNPDGSINGYKASAAFTLKVNNIETGETTEAESFQTSVSPQAASKEQAINQALQSVEEPLKEYFIKTFPVSAKILKILESKKDAAKIVLISGGKNHGIAKGDKLIVEYIEELNGKPYPTQIGEIQVEELSGNDFAKCKVIGKGGNEILARFNAAQNINCKLIVK